MPEDWKLANRFNKSWTIDDRRVPLNALGLVAATAVEPMTVSVMPLGCFRSSVMSSSCWSITTVDA